MGRREKNGELLVVTKSHYFRVCCLRTKSIMSGGKTYSTPFPNPVRKHAKTSSLFKIDASTLSCSRFSEVNENENVLHNSANRFNTFMTENTKEYNIKCNSKKMRLLKNRFILELGRMFGFAELRHVCRTFSRRC